MPLYRSSAASINPVCMNLNQLLASHRNQFANYHQRATKSIQELNGFVSWVIDQAYPKSCLMCDGDAGDETFCKQCFSELSISETLMTRACSRCALPADPISQQPKRYTMPPVRNQSKKAPNRILSHKIAKHADRANLIGITLNRFGSMTESSKTL